LISAAEAWDRFKREAGRAIEKRIPVREKSLPELEERDGRFLTNDEIAAIVNGLDDGSKQATIDRANALLEHKFTYFSFYDKPFGQDIDWHKDYKNEKRAPLIFCKDIDFQDYTVAGDFKYTWELNRHQHLIVLARAYAISKDIRYKNEVMRQAKSWIGANPYKRGINWTSPLELGIRLISWSWIWNLIGGIDQELKNKWLQTIFQHCMFISRNFSTHSSANNHLIGEAAGLFVASLTWPFEGSAGKWQESSRRILEEEIVKQTYPDGVNKEQAVSYQQFVMDFFLISALLARKKGADFPTAYWENIEKMMEFIASLMDIRGNVPNIGDADSGKAIVLSERNDFNNYRSLLAAGAVIFKRDDFKKKAQELDDKTIWLLGIDARNEFAVLAPAGLNPVDKFIDGGYYFLNANDDAPDEIKLLFDCGPLGYLSIAAHGHADALQIILSVGGREILIDPGTFVYQYPREWRDYFRGTAAHNTIRIDGKDQSVIGGYYMWLKKAKAECLFYRDDEEGAAVDGSHDGYRRFKDPVTHRRTVRTDKKNRRIIVVDDIECRKSHEVEQFFHFHPDCELERITEHEYRIANHDQIIHIRTDERLGSNLFFGSDDPIMGWKSAIFDVKEKTTTLMNHAVINGTSSFTTEILIR
jgi:hypothetical protein